MIGGGGGAGKVIGVVRMVARCGSFFFAMGVRAKEGCLCVGEYLMVWFLQHCRLDMSKNKPLARLNCFMTASGCTVVCNFC